MHVREIDKIIFNIIVVSGNRWRLCRSRAIFEQSECRISETASFARLFCCAMFIYPHCACITYDIAIKTCLKSAIMNRKKARVKLNKRYSSYMLKHYGYTFMKRKIFKILNVD